MLDDMPDNPSSGEGICLATTLFLDVLLQVSRCESSQYFLHNLPGHFQAANEFICPAWRAIGQIPLGESIEVFPALAKGFMELARTHGNDVTDQFIN